MHAAESPVAAAAAQSVKRALSGTTDETIILTNFPEYRIDQ